jgi:ABC-type transporter MlaC component
MKPMTRLLVLPLVLPLMQAAYSQQVDSRSPDQMLKETVAGVMEAIGKEPGAAAGDPDRIYQIVQKQFLPSTDFMLTTQYAVGNAWAKATPAQREALFRQFQTLLARTYALQLTQIQGTDTRFSYAPAPRLGAGASDAVVKSTVTTGGDTMAIDYRMRKTGAGWKIYDINMMGAWMIQVYRQQFAAQLGSGGIEGLIKYLAAHNQGS